MYEAATQGTDTGTQVVSKSIGVLVADGVMPRSARVAPGGFVYQVLNRSVGRMHMLRKEPDLEASERVIVEPHERQPIRILSYCVWTNHWPERNGIDKR
jgi:hypothetical protein